MGGAPLLPVSGSSAKTALGLAPSATGISKVHEAPSSASTQSCQRTWCGGSPKVGSPGRVTQAPAGRSSAGGVKRNLTRVPAALRSITPKPPSLQFGLEDLL